MIYFLTIGTVIGLSAGFAPGPLLALVISETLRHDVNAGVKVALAPLLTDLPIVLLTLVILSRLSRFQGILGAIGLMGASFLLTMAYRCFRTEGLETHPVNSDSRSVAKGVLANALSPHPYLFWFSIGAPTTTKALAHSPLAAAAFIFGFYASLVGSKILVALLIGKSKYALSPSAYKLMMRCLGLMLCVLAIALFHDGLQLLGCIRP